MTGILHTTTPDKPCAPVPLSYGPEDAYHFAFAPLDAMTPGDRVHLASSMLHVLTSDRHRPTDLLRWRGLVSFWRAIWDYSTVERQRAAFPAIAPEEDHDLALLHHLRRVAFTALSNLAAKTLDDVLALDAIALDGTHHTHALH